MHVERFYPKDHPLYGWLTGQAPGLGRAIRLVNAGPHLSGLVLDKTADTEKQEKQEKAIRKHHKEHGTAWSEAEVIRPRNDGDPYKLRVTSVVCVCGESFCSEIDTEASDIEFGSAVNQDLWGGWNGLPAEGTNKKKV